MVEKKQKPTKELPEDPLVTILTSLKQGQAQINANVQQLGKNDKILSDRMDNMEKNPPKKDILTQGIEVINALDKTGLFKILGDTFGGKEEQTATQENMIPPEDYKAYVAFRKGTMDNLLANQAEQLRALRLVNLTKEKELASDLH